MRGGLAAQSADRMSGVAIAMVALSCAVVAFGVALPLTLSDPFPAPRHGNWIIQTTVVKSTETAPAQSVAAQTTAAAPAPAVAMQAAMTRTVATVAVKAAALMPTPPMPKQSAPTRSLAAKMPAPAEPKTPAPAGPTLASASSRPVAPPPAPEPVATQPAAEKIAFATRWSLMGIAARDRIDDDLPTGTVHLALADESTPVEITPPAHPRVPPNATQIKPTERKGDTAKPRDGDSIEVIDNYLWQVYERAPVKKDSSGDFSWKDVAAAKKRGMSLQTYVIAGMEPDFREQLYHAGRAMDAAGLHWSMLSAFRDDYRQALASGFKARPGNSLHGGSRATGGYGHGRAIDIMNAGGEDESVWHWVDAHGAKYGLRRPMPGKDPAHIQAGGNWHVIAQGLRESRTRTAAAAAKSKSAKAGM